MTDFGDAHVSHTSCQPDQVQETLARKDVAKRAQINRPSRAPALLKGLIFASDGYAMTPGHSVKNGKRYRYYVNTASIKIGNPCQMFD